MGGVQVGRGGGVGENGGMSVQSMWEMGKDFCTNFLQSFLENIDRRSCNDGSWKLIPIFQYLKPGPQSIHEVANTFAYKAAKTSVVNLLFE